MGDWIGTNRLAELLAKMKAKFFSKDEATEVSAVPVVAMSTKDVDSTPTDNSDNLVTSGGVAAELADRYTKQQSDERYGKYGVISQTLTWSGGLTQPQTYTISNVVYGIIPQSSVDMFESVGAIFNSTTGYFEMNELTDLSYQEMLRIVRYAYVSSTVRDKQYLITGKVGIRTPIAIGVPAAAYSAVSSNIANMCFASSIETVNTDYSPFLIQATPLDAFNACARLRSILFVIDGKAVTAWERTFNNCRSLEKVNISHLKASISFPNSSLLSTDSILYMIQNELSTSAITITLHATAYARATADTDVQTALSAHTNVTLASTS